MRIVFAAALAFSALSLPAQAQDPQVVQALNELYYVHSANCQYGNQESCWAAQYVQQRGGQMIQAGQACQYQNNQQACNFYNNAYSELSTAYNAMQQSQWAQQAMQQPGAGLGTTHEQRMAEIQNWGAQNTANWNAQQATNDANHQRFIESIRQ